MKKELKYEIHETVSKLRKLVATLKCNMQETKEANQSMIVEVKQLKEALMERDRPTTQPRQVATTSNCQTVLTSRGRAAHATPCCDRKKLFSEVVGGKQEERHKLKSKPKQNQSTEEIKKLVKTKIDPIDMKIGIRTLKSLKNGQVLIEADSKEAIEILNSQLHDKCGSQLEINIQKRRNPRIIVYNVPDALTTENAEAIILAQNPDLKLQEGDIQAKYTFKTRRKTTNLVSEVLPHARRQMLHNKIKLEWSVCYVEDYVSVNRCFTCSGYEHWHTECRNEVACPICAGKHKLKDCAATRTEYKYTNCVRFNAHNQDRKTQTNHSSLDRNCPSLQAMIATYRQNINH